MAATVGGSDGGGVDRISSLPDDLIHVILVRLRDTAAAARTSVLSRRWRRVWAYLPELSFHLNRDVDAALAAHAAGTPVSLLEMGLPTWKPPRAADPGGLPNRLLQFASRRVAGEIRLALHPCMHRVDEIVLPTCERATAIKLSICRHTLRFQPHPGGGTFAALATLRIENAYVYGGELEDVVSSRCCPRLKELFLEQVTLMDQDHWLSLRSDSVERLEMAVNVYAHLRLQVIAPELRILSPRSRTLADCHIVAPKLSELYWWGRYDPVRHHIREAGSHLRRLEIGGTDSVEPMLMRRFNTVHKLRVTIIVTHVR
ncbi:unnamed protein product [Urochloa decumbens]|uniref:F-box domain-containing protein n=1 Tax=Urochloa decumbens TaxID=240449 RepID=A0ABC9FXH5_9POAL